MREGQVITLNRVIHAPATSVFASFTRAEGWCAWCCQIAECDGRVGGKFHICTDGYNACGEFTQLEEDRSITFTFNGDKEPPTEIHIQLDGQDGRTNLLFQITVLGSAPDVDSFMTFLEGIWGHVLDNLKTVLEKGV
jgi:uncharacterized protein YndB with AHSA1/START domain